MNRTDLMKKKYCLSRTEASSDTSNYWHNFITNNKK